jgi:hypothetical protein
MKNRERSSKHQEKLGNYESRLIQRPVESVQGDQKRWGKFTDDDLMQIEGDYDKFIGVMQGIRRAKDGPLWVNYWYEQHQATKPGSPRGWIG